MKTIVIILTLLHSLISFAENPLKGMIERSIAMQPKQTQDGYYQKLQWKDELAEYLVESKDADISILGYQFILPNYFDLVSISRFAEKHSINAVVNDINKMVKNDQLSPYGLSIALSVCHKYIKNNPSVSCDNKMIFQKQKDLSPRNAFNYIYPIHRAVEEKDEEQIHYLLEEMAQSSYVEIFYYTPEKLGNVIDDYYLTHPFGEEYLNYEKNALIKEGGLSDEAKERILSEFEEYGLLLEKINFELSIELPPFRAITDTCKSEKKFSEVCLNISNLFIKDKNIITRLLGYVIKIYILKNSDNKKAYLLADKAYKKFRAQYECIGKINTNANGFEYLNFESYKIFSSTQREKGSWAFFINQTQYFYKKAIENGNTDLKNPEECFK